MPTAPPPPVGGGWETPTAPPPAAVLVGDSVVCPRCNAANEREMRFCKECGFRLASADAARLPGAPAGMQMAPTCWRCHALGDIGALFCKFCGAAYKDAPLAGGQRAPQPPGQFTVVPPDAANQSAQLQQRPLTTTKPQPSAHPGPHGQVVARLVAILKDGSDGRIFPVNPDQTDLGRREGDIVLGDDPYLSPRHMRIRRTPEGFLLRDLESVNGVYLRIREPVELTDGDMLLLGQQVIRFELLDDGEQPLGPAMQNGVLLFGTPEVPRIARLSQYTTEGVGRDVHYLYRDETVLGRENGDIVFTDDPFMSRRHASITADRMQRRFVMRDLGSSNGSAIRFFGEKRISHGDQIRVGRHLFRFDVTGLPGGFGSR
ncbi:MAG: FHA domain-containing protein [Sandaracinaceae bacterium]|jgi:pSer/pThr/pTyr-binding forkhead associated (FHA) protein|nr:FHA domain-containing protein [Sandaracinaceae bacterium]